MPANLFFGTSIPTTVIILKKNRTTRDILFIDASSEFTKVGNQNKLTKDNLDKVVETYKKRENVEKYAYVATFDEIKENDFNLNIPRYVDTFEEEEPVDMTSIGSKTKDIRKEKEELKSSLYKMISSLESKEENVEWIQGALEVFNHEK